MRIKQTHNPPATTKTIQFHFNASSLSPTFTHLLSHPFFISSPPLLILAVVSIFLHLHCPLTLGRCFPHFSAVPRHIGKWVATESSLHCLKSLTTMTATTLWLIINAKVYNVTESSWKTVPVVTRFYYLAQVRDATDDFEDVGHIETAREMMRKYYIGEIDISTIPGRPMYATPKQPHYNQDKTTEFIIKLLQFLGGLGLVF